MKTSKCRHTRAVGFWLPLVLFAFMPLADGQTLEVLHSFQGSDGWDPHSPLVQGTDGNFYGTTVLGGGTEQTISPVGPGGWGTVFKMTPDGALTTLVIFNGTNGAYPNGLILGNDGNFYGTTTYGGNLSLSNYALGPAGWGTVFRMTPAGMLTTLASFNGTNGHSPVGGLVQGDDGNFYGVTSEGGNLSLNYGYGYGTFFKLATNGTLSAVAAFNQANGFYPIAGLAKDNDGNFYGTTIQGGAYFNGTIFRVTTNGSLTRLLSINLNPYATAVGGLAQGSDGNFYGVTHPGADIGETTPGTVFKMTPTGQLATLLSLDPAVGYPSYPPIQASDGNLYGTTGLFFRSEVLQGIVYKIMPDGTWTNLVALDSLPVAYGVSLVQGADGNLYGTAAGSDLSIDDGYGPGAIFRIVMPPLPPTLSIAQAGNQLVLSWPTNAAGFVLEAADSLTSSTTWSTNSDTPIIIGNQNTITVSNPAGSKFFRLSNP